ncbi:MAG: hypothetical protein C4551_10035 [Bacillota bacterium]|jgi:hypothetical protein|nr:MAG: hypothetical protein C4551_10035 [Bacillota bacterium]
MALDYKGIYNLWRANGEIEARVKVALVKYAQYLKALGAGATANQQTWCNSALKLDSQVDGDAEQAMKYVATDATTLSTDGVLTDAQLQTIVENWVNTVLLV